MLRSATALAMFLCCTVAASSQPQQNQPHCQPSYYDTTYSYDSLERYSLGQVWAPNDKTLSGYKGNAIVVDAGLGLVLTAAHVMEQAVGGHHRPRGRTVGLVFPRINESEVIDAKVLDFHKGAPPQKTEAEDPKPKTPETAAENSETQPSPKAVDLVRDLALLQIVNPDKRQLLRSVRLSYDADQIADAAIVSFTERSDIPGETPGKLTKLRTGLGEYAICSFNFTAGSASGKSGSPVVDRSNGQVVGLVLSSADLGAESQTTVLPIHCAADLFSGWVQRHFKDHLKSQSDLLIGMKDEDLASLLKYNTDRDLISNLVLHAAVLNFIDEINRDGITANLIKDLRSKFWCPLKEAMEARNVDLSNDKLDLLVQRMYATNSARESADTLLQEAQLNQKSNAAAANRYAHAASALYQFDRKIKETQGIETDQYAKTVKGYADSLLLAGLTEQEDAQRTRLFRQARFAALEAAFHASVYSNALSAQALTTFADAELRLNRKDKAAEGFAAAIKNGVTAKWVFDSFASVTPDGDLVQSPSGSGSNPASENVLVLHEEPQHFILKQMGELSQEGDSYAAEFLAKDNIGHELTLTPSWKMKLLTPGRV